MHRLVSIPGITFGLFLAWKVILLGFTAQPVPANDSFFYDGPVVNYLLHGKYCNPSLSQVLPISGTEVFSAYPPLYQAVLLGWMKCFGTSALAVMWLHVTLLAIFSLVVLRMFHWLRVPGAAVNLAGLFLFGITFHDRPDTLAHVLGALAMLAVVRGWFWPAAVFLLLTFATSLQIGGIYLLWVGLLTTGTTWLRITRFPWGAALTFAGTLAGLVALVKFGHPQLWAGFQEHLRMTPTVTGLRLPILDDCLKVARTAPGILFVLMIMAWRAAHGQLGREALRRSPSLLLALGGALAALALLGGCLTVLSANTIHIVGFLQPVIVASFLAGMSLTPQSPALARKHWLPTLAAALLVSIRAVGQTTWGVACARDVSYAAAQTRIKLELDSTPVASTVWAASAFLYETARHTNVTWLHSDWPASSAEPNWERRALERLKPAKLFLTQFDYHRRYATVLAEFQHLHPEVRLQITNLARVQPPDASPRFRKVVQHISWAPVIVEFSWPNDSNTPAR